MADKKVIFIGGFPSGGTDLLKNILNAHSDIYLNGEMPFLYKLPAELPVSLKENYSQDEAVKIGKWILDYDIWNNVTNRSFLEQARSYEAFEEMNKYEFFYNFFSDKDRKVWGNKTPQNTENASALLKLFPEAKLVVVTRDVRDVVLSWKKKWGKNTYLTASKWNQRMNAIFNLADQDNRILLVKFENLLSDTEIITKRICEFIGIDWDSNMLSYHEHVDKVVDGKINYGKAIKKNNKEKWKRNTSIEFVRRIEEIAFRGLRNLDYKIEHATGAKPLNQLYKWYGTCYDACAMVTVGNRAREDNSFSSRLKEVIRQVKIKSA